MAFSKLRKVFQVHHQQSIVIVNLLSILSIPTFVVSSRFILLIFMPFYLAKLVFSGLHNFEENFFARYRMIRFKFR